MEACLLKNCEKALDPHSYLDLLGPYSLLVPYLGYGTIK